MLTKLSLKNFQCHNKLLLDLGPGLTTVVGPSDTGKSSVLRALRWLATNRPRGTSIQRHGSNDTSVKVLVDNTPVGRCRSKQDNSYRMRDQKFEAMGSDVPEEVQRLLNLGPENWQGQHDPPFWLSLTAGELAKQLNQVMDLEAMDRASSDLATRHRKKKSELDVVKEREDEANRLRSKLDYVPVMERSLRELEDTTTSLTERCTRLDSLKSVASSTERLGKVVVRMDWLVVMGDSIVDRSGRLRERNAKLKRLYVLTCHVEEADHLATVEVPDMGSLETLWDGINMRQRRINELESLAARADMHEGRIRESCDALRNTESMFDQFEYCPLCGSERYEGKSNPV